MTEAWIQLSCPNCDKDWEESPSAIPGPSEEFPCPDCGKRRPVSEFARTQRDFEIVEEFHQG